MNLALPVLTGWASSASDKTEYTASPLILGLAIAVFIGAYFFIATEKIDRTIVALSGAGLMVVLGVVNAQVAFFNQHTAVDWNVIFLLFGMMVIVSVIKQTGVFEFMAIWATKKAKGKPFAVMVMLLVITAVASALLDNVTTVLLIAPVTLLVCARLGLRAIPFLIAEALVSNIGGAATLVGDPPNIIIASRSGLSFMDFLVHMGPIVLVLMVVYIGMVRVMWRNEFVTDPERIAAVMQLDEKEAIKDKTLLIKALSVLTIVLVAFSLHHLLHVDPSLIALVGAGVLVLISGLEAEEYLEEVEWPTLLFFAGLFIMVGALVQVGALDYLGKWLSDAVAGKEFLAGSVLLGASGILSAIVDNIPYVATMSPLVNDLVTSGALPESSWWALALGADLGGNATAIGASANVVVLGIAAKNGHKISFWEFTKYGFVVATVTIGIAWGYWVLRYIVMAG